MNNTVDELIAILEKTPRKRNPESIQVFLIENDLAECACIDLLIDELGNRLETKERAASIMGNLFFPIAFGYSIFLLEKDTITNSPGFFMIAFGLIVLFFLTALVLTTYYVGKRGYVWRLSNAITVLHQIEMEMLIEQRKSKEEK